MASNKQPTKQNNAKAAPKAAAKPKKLVIAKQLTQMTRGDLDAIASQVNVNAKSFNTKNALIVALKPHVRVKTPPKAKASGTQGRKVDWNKAFEWYIADHTRSYADVAKEFGVVKKTVEQAAKYTYTEGDKKGTWVTWAERRQELGEMARKKAEEDYKKSAPVRSAEHLKQYRNLQIAASNKVTMLAMQGQWLVDPNTGKKVKVQEFDARQLADVAKALKLAIDGERVIMGLPTSVSTIKPDADDETGKGWGELLALAMKQASDANEQS